MSRYFYRKSQRLSSDEDFKRVLSGKSFVCRGMLRLYRAENGLDFPRFGISVGKSCGNAVVRNRLKRLGREVFRNHQHEIQAGFDYILIFTNKMPKIMRGNTEKREIKTFEVDYKAIEKDVIEMTEFLRSRKRS